MRFAKSTGCFYPEDIDYPELPGDIVNVPQEDFDLAMSRSVRERLDLVNGHIVIIPAQPIPLEQLKVDAQSHIDAYFEKLYTMSVANNAIGAEYDAAYIVAKEWLKDTTKPAPERIKALSETYGVTNLQAAGVVVTKWTEAQATAFDLRGAARLRAKFAIRSALTPEGVAAAEAAGRLAMEGVVFSI